MITSDGPGSPGQETTKFGMLTKLAVTKFQEKYAADILAPNGLSKGTGMVGAATRAKLNALCMANPVAGATPSPAATSSAPDTLTVSMPAQPASTLAPDGALYVPFTNITLTAGANDVTVNGMTVERVGPSSDQAFADVDLMDSDGNAISTGYLDSNHHAKFGDSFVVPAGTSQTYSIVGDMQADLSGYDAQMATFQVDSIDASAPVSGSLPVRGTEQTINSSLVIGTATAVLSPNDPNSPTTHYINDTGIRFSGIRITEGSEEDISMGSITWEQVGTAASSDITNTNVVIDGISYPATTSDGRYYTATFPPPIIIKKGNSSDAYIEGDLLPSAANRTVEFDINSATDVYLTGVTYGYGIYLLPGGNTATAGNSAFLTTDGTTDGTSITPFFAGSVATIDPGALISIGH